MQNKLYTKKTEKNKQAKQSEITVFHQFQHWADQYYTGLWHIEVMLRFHLTKRYLWAGLFKAQLR